MGLWKGLTRALDPDRVIQTTMTGMIEATKWRYAVEGPRNPWAPGEPMKLLMAGYVGTRNTGADVRVAEMCRQIRHLMGDDRLELSLMTNDWNRSRGYFPRVRQVQMPMVFPPFLYDECPKHHGVIACEGSMFKSKFADALSTMMAGSLGMANAECKLSIGYGAEAGAMSEGLERFVEDHCARSLVICRNVPSRGTLESLGVRTAPGTDTAWTFEPAAPAIGRDILERYGWDGETPVLALCPINPFWWPVKPSVTKGLAKELAGEFDFEHYRSFYFHSWDGTREAQLDAYISGIAEAVHAFAAEHDVFPVCCGSEAVDRLACERLSDKLGGVPVIVSDEYDMFEFVSVLHQARYLVSSRFHAIVTSMPGKVPSAGITMDERIRNLMNDRGDADLFLEVDDPNLADRLLTILRRLHDDGEEIAENIARVVPAQLKLMGQMGIDFLDEVERVYPAFARIERPRTWEAHLPPLRPLVAGILEDYA